ncbi:MAG: hypothetical protein QOJ05_1933 [Verrucomicrobiota bacterium]
MPADPWKILSAAGTLVKVASSAALDRERQGVGARFVTDTKVTAGLSPFQAVGRQAAPARAELGQEMRQLMAQRAVDLAGIVFSQTRIQRDEGAAKIGPAGRAEKARVPFDANIASQFSGIEGLQ